MIHYKLSRYTIGTHPPATHPTVPDVPAITSINRISATNIKVTWTTLTLEESRGFLTVYSVAYHPSERAKCPEVNPETNTIVTTSWEYSQLVISDLDPRLQYCIGIAASTVAGTGDFSNTEKVLCKYTTKWYQYIACLYCSCIIIYIFVCFSLVYTNSLFQLRFFGISNCIDWVVSLLNHK